MRTPTAEHVLDKARAILASHDSGKEIDGLRLGWARMILAWNCCTPRPEPEIGPMSKLEAHRLLESARTDGMVGERQIRAALRATGDQRPTIAQEKAQLLKRLGELCHTVPSSIRDGSINATRDWLRMSLNSGRGVSYPKRSLI